MLLSELVDFDPRTAPMASNSGSKLEFPFSQTFSFPGKQEIWKPKSLGISPEFPGFWILMPGKTGKIAKILEYAGKRDPGKSREDTLVTSHRYHHHQKFRPVSHIFWLGRTVFWTNEVLSATKLIQVWSFSLRYHKHVFYLENMNRIDKLTFPQIRYVTGMNKCYQKWGKRNQNKVVDNHSSTWAAGKNYWLGNSHLCK